MQNKLIPYVPQPNKILVFVKKNSVSLGSGLLTLGLLLHVVSIVKGVQHETSEPLVIRDTVTVTKTKVKKIFVKGEKQIIYQNDTAPRTVTQVSKSDPWSYIRTYSPAAVRLMNRTGVPASITLAQGLVETNAGNSYLAKEANNHFGIKCFSRSCKKGHCVNRGDDTHKDFFRKFNTVDDCFRERGNFLKQRRYAKLFKQGRDYRKWAYGLKAAGYATDKSYATKLIGTIERYELYKYDK